MDEGIAVRQLQGLDEFRACHDVQREVWAFPDLLIIPYTQLASIGRNGGVVLGAFDGPRLVGFLAGFLGREVRGPLYLFSQRMGVLPKYQGRGIGERLKRQQRAWALEQGLDRIVWTYDPLEAANATLNITKLGGIVRHYERDIYGQHETPLHSDLPTDRFRLEWELSSPRVLACLEARSPSVAVEEMLDRAGPPLNRVTWDDRGLPACRAIRRGLGEPALLVEVPADWQGLRQADMALAADWRAQTRQIFEESLQQGYAITGYSAGQVAGRRRNFYLLERK